MSRFQPRLFSVIVFALVCIKSSFATPVASAGRSRFSIIAVSEPVNILSSEDLAREESFPSDHSTIINDGTTVTTTFNERRNGARKRDFVSLISASEVSIVPASEVSIVSASEPVNIIDSEDFSPGQLSPNGGSTTTNDGTTLTTTYNNRRSIVRRNDSIATASEPVNVMSTEEIPPGHTFTSGTTTNDGTTVTTEFSPTGSNVTNSLNLLSTKNRTLADSELQMGETCEGSKLMCIGASQANVMDTLRGYMDAIPAGYRYYAGQDIACIKNNVYPSPLIAWGYYCAFMQGHIPVDGVDGTVIQLKMQQLIEHRCLGCGSVRFSYDNDPMTLGILTVNYVRKSKCEGLCYYVPPGTAASTAVKVPTGMTLAS